MREQLAGLEASHGIRISLTAGADEDGEEWEGSSSLVQLLQVGAAAGRRAGSGVQQPPGGRERMDTRAACMCTQAAHFHRTPP